MNNRIHPAVAVTLIVLVVGVAVYFVYKGMEPQREPNPMSQEEINKQMRDFNAGKRPGSTAQMGGAQKTPGK